jgi:hypothetical protein
MTNEKAIMCLEDMKIKVPIPKAAKQARENNEALDVAIKALQSAEPKSGKWILDRSGAYCCSECMEPCAGYVMMKPRDKFCRMCGSRNEVTE